MQLTIANADSLADSVLDEIKEAVVSDFLGESETSGNTRVSLASEVYASRFYQAVMSADGTEELENIQVRLGDDDWALKVTIDADEEPVMTTDDVYIIAGE